MKWVINNFEGQAEIMEFGNGRFEHHSYVDVSGDVASLELPDGFKGAIVRDLVLPEDSEVAYKDAFMESVDLVGFPIPELKAQNCEDQWYCYLECGENEHCLNVSNQLEELKLKARESNALPINLDNYRMCGNEKQDIYKLPSFQMLRATSHYVAVDVNGEILENMRGDGANQPFLSDVDGQLSISRPSLQKDVYLIAQTAGGYIGMEQTGSDGGISRVPIKCSASATDDADSLLNARAYEAGWRLRYDDVADALLHGEQDGRCFTIMGVDGIVEKHRHIEEGSNVRPCVLSRDDLVGHLPAAAQVVDTPMEQISYKHHLPLPPANDSKSISM